MDTYRIAIDTFIAEAFECRASVCAIFTGTDIAFQHVQPHTRRDKSELHLMAGSMRSAPKKAAPLRLTFSKSALVKNKLAY